jgi:hypothetical protein
MMEIRPKSLQQMFDDAQDIQHNIQACKQIQNEELDAKENKREYEHKMVDWNLEHIVNHVIGPLEIPNTKDVATNYVPLVEREGANLVVDPSHDKQGADYFMYSFIDNQEDECTN